MFLGVYTQDIDTTTTMQVMGFGNVWKRMNSTLIKYQTLLLIYISGCVSVAVCVTLWKKIDFSN